MTSSLDMSLDDLIQKNKKTYGGAASSRGRGGGAGGGVAGAGACAGPARRFPNRSGNRPAPYSVGKAPDSAWQHDMYSGQMAAVAAAAAAAAAYPAPGVAASAIETGTKLYISNLDYGVSNEDIKELFSEVGDLKRYSINYDRSGRSKGTAEVVFSRRADAIAAVKRYNNVLLDGKPMKIEIIGTNIETPAILPFPFGGTFGNPNGAPKSGPGRGGPSGWVRGGGGGGSGSRGRGRGRGNPISSADLDAELDKYHAEAMQLN
ncbi:THO complex subunit 4A-like [Ananas comosus]|uniref:THO complex subunit 4A-like n=1 Tax=Ananas comosus TaxID=4615 RepID=A0A6P5G6E0_ANACO|nr:THO complex subunit 4A-like [Ananas comosus]